MKKLMTVLISFILLFNSAFVLNTVRADEPEEDENVQETLITEDTSESDDEEFQPETPEAEEAVIDEAPVAETEKTTEETEESQVTVTSYEEETLQADAGKKAKLAAFLDAFLCIKNSDDKFFFNTKLDSVYFRGYELSDGNGYLKELKIDVDGSAQLFKSGLTTGRILEELGFTERSGKEVYVALLKNTNTGITKRLTIDINNKVLYVGTAVTNTTAVSTIADEKEYKLICSIEQVIYNDELTHDDEGDIKIFFTDGEFLEAFKEGESWVTVNGYGCDSEENCYGYYDECYSIVDDEYLIIPYEYIMANHVEAGKEISIDVETNSVDYHFCIVLEKGCKSVPEYTAQMVDGSIVVTGPKDFIDNVMKYYVDDLTKGKYMGYSGGGIILGSSVYGDYWFQNSMQYETDYTGDRPTMVRINDTSLKIDKEQIMCNNIMAGTYTLKAEAYGYGRGDGISLTIEEKDACKKVTAVPVATVTADGIVITSTDLDWLAAAAKTRKYLDRSNGFKTLEESSQIILISDNWNYYYFHNQDCYDSNNERLKGSNEHCFSYYADAETPYILIPNQMLSYKKVRNGTYTIEFDTYGYEVYSISLGELSGYSETVSSVTASQDQESGDIYIRKAADAGSTDSRFLKAICELREEDNQEYYYSNTHITFQNRNKFLDFMNYNEDTIDLTYGVDEAGPYVKIEYDRILEVGMTSGEYEITFHVSGYEADPVQINISGAKPAPTSYLIEQNTDGDLVITFGSECGEYVRSFDNSEGRLIFFKDNEWFKNTWVGDSRIIADENNGTITVKASYLSDNGFLSGNYRIGLSINGYEKLYIDYNGLTTNVKDPAKKITVSQNSVGDIVIKSDDTNYLKALSRPTIYEDNIQTQNGGNISKNGSGFEINNYQYQNGDYTYNDTPMKYSGKTITIKKQVLIDSYWSTGECQITLSAPGYTKQEFTVNLTKLCKPFPSDLSVDYVEGTGIVIETETADYLNKLANHKVSPGLDVYSNGSNAGGSFYDFDMVYEDGKAIIPDSALKLKGIGDCTCGMNLYAYGYAIGYVYDLEVTSALENVPSDVSVVLDKNGYLHITSEEEDFISALKTEYNSSLSPSENLVGHFFVDNNRWLLTNISCIPDTGDNEAIIPINEITYLNGEHKITIRAYGYKDIEKTFTFKAITPGSIIDDGLNAGDTIQLGFDSEKELTWSIGENGNGEAAIDENGILSGIKPGKVTVNVSDGEYGSSIDVMIWTYDAKGKITAAIEGIESTGFEAGDEAQVVVKDNGEEKNARIFRYDSSNTAITSVDENGTVTAVGTGSATINVYIDGTSIKVASVKVTVVNTQWIQLFLCSENGEELEELRIGKDVKQLQFTVKGESRKHGVLDVSANEVSFVSSDTAVATVDKNGKVTVKKPGQFNITATTTKNSKNQQVSDSVIVRVLDYTPVLESEKVTLNKYLEAGADIRVYAKTAFGSSIEDIYFDETSRFTIVSRGNDAFNIRLKDEYAGIKNGTYKETLNVTVSVPGEESETYSFAQNITVTSTLPSIKISTSGQYNTFTNENTLKISAVGDYEIMEFVDCWAEADDEGNVTPAFDEEKGTYKLKGTVRFYFEGYTVDGYVDKVVTFKSVNKKPDIKLDTTSVKLYVPADCEDDYKQFTVHLKEGKNVIVPEDSDIITVSGLESDCGTNDEDLVIMIRELKSGTVKLNYKKENWSGSIPLTVKVTVDRKEPTVKLEKTSITLNNRFLLEDGVGITVSSLSDSVVDIDVKEANSKIDYPEGLNVYLDDNMIKVSCAEGDTAGKNYKYTITPYIEVNGERRALKAVTLTVIIDASLPKFKAEKSSFTLNKQCSEEVTFNVEASVSSLHVEPSIALTGVYLAEYNSKTKTYSIIDTDSPVASDYYYEDNETGGPLTVCLTDEAMDRKLSSLTYYLLPEYNGEIAESSSTKITVKVIDKKPAASISIKGSLNQLNRSINATGTVKLSNIVSAVETVEIKNITGKVDAEKYIGAVYEDGKIIYSLNDENLSVLKDQTLEFNTVLNTVSGESISAVTKIKLARTAPSVKLASSTINVYDLSRNGEEVARVKLNINETDLAKITRFWSNESAAYSLSLVGDEIIVRLTEGANVKSGSTVKFTIKIDWENDYGVYEDNIKGLKTSSLTLNVKDVSGSVKARSVTK